MTLEQLLAALPDAADDLGRRLVESVVELW